jgi:tRNA(adenine34) deaminase
MLRAIEIAVTSAPDIPVGCLILYNNKIIAEAHNEVEKQLDPTAHAELLCIRRACHILGRKNLTGCTLVSTLEPCEMCEAAIKLARIPFVIFGAFQEIKPGPTLDFIGGICEKECRQLVQDYFVQIRSLEG